MSASSNKDGCKTHASVLWTAQVMWDVAACQFKPEPLREVSVGTPYSDVRDPIRMLYGDVITSLTSLSTRSLTLSDQRDLHMSLMVCEAAAGLISKLQKLFRWDDARSSRKEVGLCKVYSAMISISRDQEVKLISWGTTAWGNHKGQETGLVNKLMKLFVYSTMTSISQDQNEILISWDTTTSGNRKSRDLRQTDEAVPLERGSLEPKGCRPLEGLHDNDLNLIGR
ncbi:hypothetical protein TWF696_003911 [Orbilia brochopaga]|uniref:Uncharacterized protein n=1 Tax=Orbilia brochopaga TaxID=3140254 RepID=A0AAV9V6V9_9PEZI